ncbi:DUF6301 family protein [Nocardia rosealba]|uniref:DUF6301 family protein n=1 Tax=Nocardia rosealba TaxID=2878563 RepID=UPI001CDA11E7|nr:DUF6301 family protein [Nocardia rosealba]MCA2210210.1 DUF6301 family protein [Nocardia rosealba]
MKEWKTLSENEIADLATRLRDLDWSWQMTDVDALAARFGWRVEATRPHSVRLDTGFGRASGSVQGYRGRANEIDLAVTGFTSETTATRADIRDAFVVMATAITGAVGAPTNRIPGEYAEVRWAGPDTTLRLIEMTSSIHLYLDTNAGLAVHDETVRLEAEGVI